MENFNNRATHDCYGKVALVVAEPTSHLGAPALVFERVPSQVSRVEGRNHQSNPVEWRLE